MLNTVGLDATDETTGADLSLQEVIWISEEVKRVMLTTRAIRLEAINAMLISRRAGTLAVGFKVVSNQLRIFSARVEERMADLSELIYALTTVAADREKGSRMYHYFLDAAKIRQAGEHDYLDELLAHEHECLQWLAGTIRTEREKLHKRATLIWKDCGMSRTLARNARIEAAAGGAMAVALTQVANQVEATVERVHVILGKLKNLDMGKQA